MKIPAKCELEKGRRMCNIRHTLKGWAEDLHGAEQGHSVDPLCNSINPHHPQTISTRDLSLSRTACLRVFVFQPRSLEDGPFLRTRHGNLLHDEDRISLASCTDKKSIIIFFMGRRGDDDEGDHKKFIVHDTYCVSSVPVAGWVRWKEGSKCKETFQLWWCFSDLKRHLSRLAQSEFFISLNLAQGHTSLSSSASRVEETRVEWRLIA